MPDRITKVVHKGKTVLLSDFSGLAGPELMSTLSAARTRDLAEPAGSLLLVDVTKAKVNNDVRKVAIEMGETAKRRGFRQAIVGIDGIQRIIFSMVQGHMYLGRSRQDALDWLVSGQDRA